MKKAKSAPGVHAGKPTAARIRSLERTLEVISCEAQRADLAIVAQLVALRELLVRDGRGARVGRGGRREARRPRALGPLRAARTVREFRHHR